MNKISFWHRTVSCSKSTWDFITFLVCCLGNGHISYLLETFWTIYIIPARSHGKSKNGERAKKLRIFPVSFCAGAWFAIVMQPLRKTNFLLASESLLDLGLFDIWLFSLRKFISTFPVFL